jgi:hypothetical protein
MWLRSGHVFDQIFAYEFRTPVEEFYKTVPPELQDHVHYLQCAVVSSPEEEKPGVSPFLPSVMKREATAADYVLFKLDIDSPKVEHGSIDFILNDPNNIVDEIAFEHHGESSVAHTPLSPIAHTMASITHQTHILHFSPQSRVII